MCHAGVVSPFAGGATPVPTLYVRFARRVP